MRNVPDLHDMEYERTYPEITSSYDLEKDAYNRWCAMNAFTNGRGYETMSDEDRKILAQVKGLSEEEANKVLFPYLDKKYQANRKYIEEAVHELKTDLDIQKDAVFDCMEKLTKHPILRNNFHIYFTTCKRGPYAWETGEIWMSDPSKKEWRTRNWTLAFAHELLHMQTHKYYQFKYPMNQLNRRQFNLIKESLTFLLNHEFPGVGMAIDRGYPNHQDFREFLENYRLSCGNNKDFDDLIKVGCDEILEKKMLVE